MKSNIESALAKVLADTYTLAIKTQGYHWNVEGLEFYQLHKLFEEQYNELQPVVDELAERLRALGFKAPGSLKEFLALTSIDDGNHAGGVKAMLTDLKTSHEALVHSAQAAKEAAEANGDDETVDILVGRITAHQKHIWFLGGLLK